MSKESTTPVLVQAQHLSPGDIVNGHAVVTGTTYMDDDATTAVAFWSYRDACSGCWFLPDAQPVTVTGIERF
jgi:hypothetical protein